MKYKLIGKRLETIKLTKKKSNKINVSLKCSLAKITKCSFTI